MEQLLQTAVKYYVRTLSQLLFLALSGAFMWADSDWDLVYPVDYPQKEDLSTLCIAVHHDRQSASEYLIGSRDGYVLYAQAASPLAPLDWQIIKLPIDHDVTAVSHLHGTWFLGTAEGSTLRYTGVSPGLSAADQDWQVTPGVLRPILNLVALNESYMLYRSDYETRFSTDGGLSWQKHDLHLTQTGDLETFKGKFYGILTRYSYNTQYLQLLVSANGQEWDTVWEIEASGQLAGTNLRILTEAFDRDGYPVRASARLHVSAYFTQSQNSVELRVSDEIHLSTLDGVNWRDTGSVKHILVKSDEGGLKTEDVEWNPLFLPDDQRYFSYPEMIDHFSGDLDTNLLVTNEGLYRYDKTNISSVFATKQDPGANMSRSTITQWGKLMWISGLTSAGGSQNTELVTLSKEGDLASYQLPTVEVPVLKWQQLLATGGGTFALAECEDGSQRLFRSTDLTSWQAIPLPEDSREVVLKYKANQLAAFYKDGDYSGPNRIAVWDDGWTVELSLPMRFTDPTYVKQTGRWYCVYPARYSVLIIEITDEGYHREIGRFHQSIVISDARDFYKISSPDNEHLFVYGGTPEFGVFNTSGFIKDAWPPGGTGSRNPIQINTVHHVNGWYYVPARTTSRTQDFATWEVMDIPENEEGIYVTHFGDDLLFFTKYSVYRRPLQKGYLDSVESDNGWHYSDWLGWFTITDASAGLINHLQLGACQVSQVNENEYRLESTALGSILVQKDKPSWIYQKSTNKWYRLDRETWAPRMWDPDTETWVEIKP